MLTTRELTGAAMVGHRDRMLITLFRNATGMSFSVVIRDGVTVVVNPD
jgi:hypothetical protein